MEVPATDLMLECIVKRHRQAPNIRCFNCLIDCPRTKEWLNVCRPLREVSEFQICGGQRVIEEPNPSERSALSCYPAVAQLNDCRITSVELRMFICDDIQVQHAQESLPVVVLIFPSGMWSVRKHGGEC
jgi:hypothetical protein